MIPDSFIQELLDRVDIVDVVQRYVPLKKAGANYSACCPFHSEKSPSFTVSPSKQFYHCFGCGAHGSAIGFVMAHQGLGFVDAVEELAGNLGLSVPNESKFQPNPQYAEKKASLTDLMARAARYYKDQLKQSPVAIEYLKGRGLTGQVAARFGLGYAPDAWQGLESIFSDYKAEELATAGLVIDNEQGRRYDRFRDRIMFPILDARSNVIGFGGRVLGDGTPKYLNSPETPLFEKGRELYGLTQARQAIRDHDTVIVVEGYMDVVALAQHGIGNAVATLGTATTGEHVHKLMRQAEKIVFCFDGDKAGRKAAWRALENSLPQLADDHSVGFLFLPPEHDPDSYVREHGAEAFQKLVSHPTTLPEFLLRELTSEVDCNTAEGRARLIHDAKPLVTQIGAPLLQLQIVKQLAQLSGLTQAEIEGQYGIKPMAVAARRAPPPPRSRPSARPLENQLLEIILQHPSWVTRLPLEAIASDTPEGATLHAIANSVEHGDLGNQGIGMLIEHFRGTPHESMIASLASQLGDEVDSAEQEHVLNDAVLRIQQRQRNQQVASKKGQLSKEEWLELLSHKGKGNPNP